ncbi:MAG: methyltransferase domain-containing protein [Candidatus Cloacimonadota bacterium]|nr:methyltransferase domain-containing protein [Candidatus Cloacimonadota bacterium]
MAIPILKNWHKYFLNSDEGMGSSYERIILNKKIEKIIKVYRVKSILEAPSFGFTGVSGINSMQFAKNGISTTVLDNDKFRTEKVKEVWEKMKIPVNLSAVDNFKQLNFEDNSFDMSWNFSALWFVNDLQKFLSELDRVTKKVIFLSVPNRLGIGYITQKYLGKDDMKKYLKEENIIPKKFVTIMNDLDWQLFDKNFIDCPPWPDIGMPKDKFLKIFKLDWLLKKEKSKPVSILNWYADKDLGFERKMLSLSYLEEKAPWIFKRFWAHHRYYMFIKNEN